MKLEVRKITVDDLELYPQCLNNSQDGNPKIRGYWVWGTLFPEDSDTPHFYFRSMMPDQVRKNGGFIKMGKGPLGKHTSAHHEGIAQGGTSIVPYHKTKENPDTYETWSEDGCFHLAYTADGIEVKEGDILNAKIEFFPYFIMSHNGTSNGDNCWFVQFGTLTGTYEGKEVKAICVTDRLFEVEGRTKKSIHEPLNYIKSYHAGIREDGRRECFYAGIKKNDGVGEGFYWLEGEEPICTTKVTLEAEWYKLPYVPEDDGTVVFKESVWKLGDDIKVHCKCEYGSKGWLPEPRLEVKGLGQTFGDFYVGDEPYKHVLWHTLNECTGATVEHIREMGFVVHE